MEKKWSHLFENRKEAENSIRWKNGEKKPQENPGSVVGPVLFWLRINTV